MDKNFLLKLRQIRSKNQAIMFLSSYLRYRENCKVVYLEYFKSHNLLSVSASSPELGFEFKTGISISEDTAKAIVTDNKIPKLLEIEKYLPQPFLCFPIKHNGTLFGLVLLDSVKDHEIIKNFYIPNFCAILAGLYISKNSIGYAQEAFYKTLEKLYRTSEKLSLLSIYLPDENAVKHIKHYLYRLRKNEFALFMETDLKDAASKAEILRRDLLKAGFKSAIGVSGFPYTGESAESLLYSAGAAMSKVKSLFKVCAAKSIKPELTI